MYIFSAIIQMMPVLFFVFSAAALFGAGSPEAVEVRESGFHDSEDSGTPISLPPPKSAGELSLEESLDTRGAQRSYSDRPLALNDLSQLLWAGCGQQTDAVSGATGTAPSAGGLYPQELFVFVGDVEDSEGSPDGEPDSGVYGYDPEEHRLLPIQGEDLREELARAALNQRFIAEAPAVIVIGAVAERTAAKYGERGADRYVYMDVGHSAQNISLQSTALGLASAPVGAFDDRDVSALLGETDASPLYIIPVGHPR